MTSGSGWTGARIRRRTRCTSPAASPPGKWEGDTLTARLTHLKTAWIRRGVGIPGSDETIITLHITRHDDLLTMTTIQEDPDYLTEPHVVSRVWQWNPRGTEFDRPTCNTANEIPRLEDTGVVPHYLPGQNPEEDYMMREFNIPKEAAMGYAETLYPEYRKKLKGIYKPPADCCRARRATAAAGSRRRDGRAARPTSPATTAASACSAREDDHGAQRTRTSHKAQKGSSHNLAWAFCICDLPFFFFFFFFTTVVVSGFIRTVLRKTCSGVPREEIATWRTPSQLSSPARASPPASTQRRKPTLPRRIPLSPTCCESIAPWPHRQSDTRANNSPYGCAAGASGVSSLIPALLRRKDEPFAVP